MKIDNIFQINDWEFDRFIMAIIGVQLAVWGFAGLGCMGIVFPLITTLVCVIYLLFIPGITALRALKLHGLGSIETVLYSLGLSIALLMLTGFILNSLLPVFGDERPLTPVSLTLGLSVLVIGLCVIAYRRDTEYHGSPEKIDVADFFSPISLVICSIPFMVMVGSYLVNYYHSNMLLLWVILIIAFLAIYLVFRDSIPEKYYPLAVFSIALSILFHNSLISSYIFAWDIHQEYYWANLVIQNSFWQVNNFANVNDMLSIVILAPAISKVCFMDLSSVFKIIYPFIFAFTTLCIYATVRKQINSARIAFLSCFFFISLFVFYTEMLNLARQQIAEFFLVLIVMLLVNTKIKSKGKSLVLILFGMSLIVSHYGLSYIYAAIFVSAWFIVEIYNSAPVQKFFTYINKIKFFNIDTDNSDNVSGFNLTFVFIYVAFLFIWYIYVSPSPFESILNIVNRVSSSVSTDLFNPEYAEGLAIVSQSTYSFSHDIAKYFHLTTQFFIGIGILSLLVWKKYKVNRVYYVFGLLNLLICIAGIAVPFFASAINTTRLYHIALLVLAPFGVIGGIFVLEVLSWILLRVLKLKIIIGTGSAPIKILSVFMVIFMLFNVQFIYENINDGSNSFSISQESMKKSKDYNDIIDIYTKLHTDQEISGVSWLSGQSVSEHTVYSDGISHYVLYSYGMIPTYLQSTLPPITGDLDKNSYIYLGYVNLKYNILNAGVRQPIPIYSALNNSLTNANWLYTNGGSKIGLVP